MRDQKPKYPVPEPQAMWELAREHLWNEMGREMHQLMSQWLGRLRLIDGRIIDVSKNAASRDKGGRCTNVAPMC